METNQSPVVKTNSSFESKLNGVAVITAGLAMAVSAVVFSRQSPGHLPLAVAVLSALACAYGGALLFQNSLDFSEADAQTKAQISLRWSKLLIALLSLGFAIGAFYKNR